MIIEVTNAAEPAPSLPHSAKTTHLSFPPSSPSHGILVPAGEHTNRKIHTDT